MRPPAGLTRACWSPVAEPDPYLPAEVAPGGPGLLRREVVASSVVGVLGVGPDVERRAAVQLRERAAGRRRIVGDRSDDLAVPADGAARVDAEAHAASLVST